MKTCTKCKETKALGEFGKDKSRRGGLAVWCRECSRAYREANRETIKARAAVFYENNREAINVKAAVYRENNVEKIKAQQKTRREENREKKKSTASGVPRKQS